MYCFLQCIWERHKNEEATLPYLGQKVGIWHQTRQKGYLLAGPGCPHLCSGTHQRQGAFSLGSQRFKPLVKEQIHHNSFFSDKRPVRGERQAGAALGLGPTEPRSPLKTHVPGTPRPPSCRPVTSVYRSQKRRPKSCPVSLCVCGSDIAIFWAHTASR